MNLKSNIFYKILRRVYFTANKLFPRKSPSELEYSKESKADKKNGLFFNPLGEMTIKEFRKQGGLFNDFSLAETSVRAFLFHLFKRDLDSYHICEFGGGQSTLFWNVLSQKINLSVTTFEHDPEWAKYLESRIATPNIKINYCELMQIDESCREMMFASPMGARETWAANISKITPEQYKDPVLRNGFYNISTDQLPTERIDAIVLDGPHGNGRSIAFPIFYQHIINNTLVLLDDYHHYPFLDDLSKVFEFEILEERRYKSSNKGWVILNIIKKTS